MCGHFSRPLALLLRASILTLHMEMAILSTSVAVNQQDFSFARDHHYGRCISATHIYSWRLVVKSMANSFPFQCSSFRFFFDGSFIKL